MACRESTEIEDRQNSAMQQTDNLTNRRRKRWKVTNKCCDRLGNWKQVEWEGGCVSQVTSNMKKHAALVCVIKGFLIYHTNH